MAEKTQEEKDAAYLAHADPFWRFLEGLHNRRERAIAEMDEADDATLRKLAGRVSAYTEILQEHDWEGVRRRMILVDQ